jgi:hypothetical protein
MNQLLFFYYGSHPDHRGRMLREILDQDDDWFEGTHDFIQWLFPLEVPSRASLHAPLVDGPTKKVFASDPLLRDHMRAALSRMLRFLGLRFDGTTLTVGPGWANRRTLWFAAHGHNSLRITRILKSMSLLGLKDEARALNAGLQALCDSESDCAIPAESRRFWAEAVA